MIKTIFVAPIFEPWVELIEPAQSVAAYAISLANTTGAHLNITVGSCQFSVPSIGIIPDAASMVSAANAERRAAAQQFGERLLGKAKLAGVVASLDVVHDDYPAIVEQSVRRARRADIAVVQTSDDMFSLVRGVAEEILFNSGRPVIFVPSTWNADASMKRIILAWDGSGKSARALGDALPFVEVAETVEIVAIGGDPDKTKKVAGTDIAPHVTRHAKKVTITELPAVDGDVARVLRAHAQMTRADMIVMGAFGHARLRQFILGGVTSDFVKNPPVPTLMSY